jgi:sulfur carrier protein
MQDRARAAVGISWVGACGLWRAPRGTVDDRDGRGNLDGMRLTVNGEAYEAPEGISVRTLVERLGLTQGPVAVERNREVVPRAEHASTMLGEADIVEIVHFVGGG